MQTVVGVFDTVDEAQSARVSLINDGFDPGSVTVQSNTGTLAEGDQAATGSTYADGTGDGFMASVGRFFTNLFGGDDNEHAGHYAEAVRRGGSVVAVTVDDDSRVEAARTALAAAGAVDIDRRTEAWRQEGYSGFNPTARPYQADEIQAERSRYQAQPVAGVNAAEAVIPVVREDIEVGKREVDLGRVRVFSRTETRPFQEQVQLREEHAEIERRAVDRPATEADLKAFEGGAIEIQETAERAVVSKTARVVEEVTVGTQATTRTETISDQLRSTVVDVENDTHATGTADVSTGYRNHYQTNLASLGGSYDDYAPAYQYGSTLRGDARYAGRSWDEVESDAQRDWSSRYPDSSGGSTWERMKAAVRHGWESATGQR